MLRPDSFVFVLAAATSTILHAQRPPETQPGLRPVQVDDREVARVVGTAVTAAPDGSDRVHHFKMLDGATGRIRGVSLTESGRQVDGAAVVAAQAAAAREAAGRLGGPLRQLAPMIPEGTTIPVSIWLDSPAPLLPVTLVEGTERLTAERSERNSEQIRLAYRANASPVIARVETRLRELGCVFVCDPELPCVYAMIESGQLAAVAGLADVDSIDLAIEPRSEMRNAKAATRINQIPSWPPWRVVNGHGVKIALIEQEGSDVDLGNHHFNGSSIFAAGGSDGSPDVHATFIAGILVSDLGVARGAQLRIGGLPVGTPRSAEQFLLESELRSAMQWGAEVTNASYGFPTARFPINHDRFYDSMAYLYRRAIVKSVGNVEVRTGYYNPYAFATSPGLGYNVITVGAYDHNDSGYRGDDSFAVYSCWKGPVSMHGGRSKPDLVAPGRVSAPCKRSMFSQDRTAVGQGTSYAAPIVAGTIALMHQLDTTRLLRSWPEAVRAILMASTFHNIAGAPGFSRRDGAGGLDARNAVRCVEGDQRAGFRCSYYGSYVPQSWPMHRVWLASGIRAKIAITWAVDPSDSQWLYMPGADLDLVVLDPSGRPVGFSTSYDDNFEVVEFMPTVSGYYTVQIHRYRMHRPPNYLGMAWCQEW